MNREREAIDQIWAILARAKKNWSKIYHKTYYNEIEQVLTLLDSAIQDDLEEARKASLLPPCREFHHIP